MEKESANATLTYNGWKHTELMCHGSEHIKIDQPIVIELAGKETVIGRAPYYQLSEPVQLEDLYKGVVSKVAVGDTLYVAIENNLFMRKQFSIERFDDGGELSFWIKDLGSSGGTLVNRQRILGLTLLKPGDHISFGFCFDYGDRHCPNIGSNAVSTTLLKRIDDAQRSIIQIGFSGNYPPGSAGNETASSMCRAVRRIIESERPSAVLLDLREMSYGWGDAIGSLAVCVVERESKKVIPACVLATGQTVRAIQRLFGNCFTFSTLGIPLFTDEDVARQYLQQRHGDD